MKRVVTAELLDTDSGSAQEVADSLLDLQWINKTFGGVATTTDLLRTVCARLSLRELIFLDVGAASGDVPGSTRTTLAKTGIHLYTTLLDLSFTHLPKGKSEAAVVGDALTLPFQDDAFDVVGSSLFIHHLEADEIVRFVNEALRVSRHACIINDLHRSYLHLIAVRLGGLLYRSRLTRHDSVASVRRAYTRDELKTVLAKSNAAHFEFSDHFLFRMGVIAWKKRP